LIKKEKPEEFLNDEKILKDLSENQENPEPVEISGNPEIPLNDNTESPEKAENPDPSNP